jgi:hypothetical protein
MQYGLIYVVGGHIKDSHNKWVSQIVHLKDTAWYHVIPMPYNYAPPACMSEDSNLCLHEGDHVSCAPGSVEILTDWKLLDINGDGIWSSEEANNDKMREEVQCAYGVDLVYLYTSIVGRINATDALKGRRNADLLAGTGLHHAYFNWYLHKPLLCQYGEADMCGTLFHRGFFDEALREQSTPDFSDVNTALAYCNHMLMQECFDILPNTYKVWRSRTQQLCGEKVFGHSMYQIPDDAPSSSSQDRLPMLTVSFAVQQVYESTADLKFRVFLGILLVTFLSKMYLEIKSIWRMFLWTIAFPHDKDAGRHGNIVSKEAVRICTDKDDSKLSMDRMNDRKLSMEDTEKTHDDPESSTTLMTPRGPEVKSMSIVAVRTDHRIAVALVTVLRFFLWAFLLWSGIMFLTGQPRYLTLIFDALSLVFISEIDELLYATMLRHEFREDHYKIDDMVVRHIHRLWLPISGRKFFWNDILQFVAIIVFASVIVYTFTEVELNPLIASLQCLCSRDGPECYDAQQFSRMWWDRYWSTTLPAANDIIDQLKDL